MAQVCHEVKKMRDNPEGIKWSQNDRQFIETQATDIFETRETPFGQLVVVQSLFRIFLFFQRVTTM